MSFALDVHGQRIHVATWGESGPVVVLLHSSGMASGQWRRLAERLAPRHRVLAPDLIAYGASAPWAGPGDVTYEDDVGVAQAVAAHAGEPVHLVGHSYGGLLALAVARAPAPGVRLASLSVYDPVAFGVLYSAADAEGLADVAAGEAQGDLFAPALSGTIAWCERFVDYWNGAGAWAQMDPARRAAFAREPVKMFHEVRSLVRDRTPHQAYAGIDVPTLLVTGSLTPVAARRIVAVLARTLPQARVETIAGAGHMGPLTHADVVNAKIVAAIAAATGAASAAAPRP